MGGPRGLGPRGQGELAAVSSSGPWPCANPARRMRHAGGDRRRVFASFVVAPCSRRCRRRGGVSRQSGPQTRDPGPAVQKEFCWQPRTCWVYRRPDCPLNTYRNRCDKQHCCQRCIFDEHPSRTRRRPDAAGRVQAVAHSASTNGDEHRFAWTSREVVSAASRKATPQVFLHPLRRRRFSSCATYS